MKKDFAVSASDEVELRCLEIYCNEDPLSERHYLVNDRASHTVTLEDDAQQLFSASSFKVDLPPSTGESVSDITLAIDDIAGTVREYVRRVEQLGVIHVVMRFYLLSDLTTPQLNPPLRLTVSDVEVNAFQVSARISLYSLQNEVLQSLVFDLKGFPNLS